MDVSTLPLLQDGDLIWAHDYHCIPLGDYLRHAKVASPLGFECAKPLGQFDMLGIGSPVASWRVSQRSRTQSASIRGTTRHCSVSTP